MNKLHLFWLAAALAVAGCAGTGTMLPDSPESCNTPAAIDADLPGDATDGTDAEEENDGNCGGGNDPDGTDPDNPGQGHTK